MNKIMVLGTASGVGKSTIERLYVGIIKIEDLK